jgi:hypothetical protein
MTGPIPDMPKRRNTNPKQPSRIHKGNVKETLHHITREAEDCVFGVHCECDTSSLTLKCLSKHIAIEPEVAQMEPGKGGCDTCIGCHGAVANEFDFFFATALNFRILKKNMKIGQVEVNQSNSFFF